MNEIWTTNIFVGLVIAVVGFGLLRWKEVKGPLNYVAITLMVAGLWLIVGDLLPDVAAYIAIALLIFIGIAVLRLEGGLNTIVGTLIAIAGLVIGWQYLSLGVREFLSTLWDALTSGISSFFQAVLQLF